MLLELMASVMVLICTLTDIVDSGFAACVSAGIRADVGAIAGAGAKA